MPRPVILTDTIHDFGPNGDIILYLSLNVNSFTPDFTQNGGSAKGALRHNLSQGVPTLPRLENIDGQYSPPASAPVIKEVLPGNNNFTNTPVTVKDLGPNYLPNFKIGIPSPGRWQSDFDFYVTYFLFGNDVYANLNNIANGGPYTEYYIYKVYQKAVAIIEDISSTPTVVNGQTANISINSLVRVNKGKSRGKEISSGWTVQVRDSNGNFINAVQGTDYTITFGNLSTDILEIKVTQPKVFRIINNISGYTTSNNIFPGTGYGNVSVNDDSTFYILNVQGVIENNQDIITLPKINAQVTIQNQISATPVQTGYASANITVIGSLDTASGNYSIKDLNTGIITNVPMTEAQWIQEFNTRTNIKLEIRRKTTNEVVISKDGLGPHLNINTPSGDFIVQFKTISK